MLGQLLPYSLHLAVRTWLFIHAALAKVFRAHGVNQLLFSDQVRIWPLVRQAVVCDAEPLCGLFNLELYSLRDTACEEVAEMLFAGTLCGDASSAPASLLSEERVNQSFDAKSTRTLTQSWHDGSLRCGSHLSARPSFPISPICQM